MQIAVSLFYAQRAPLTPQNEESHSGSKDSYATSVFSLFTPLRASSWGRSSLETHRKFKKESRPPESLADVSSTLCTAEKAARGERKIPESPSSSQCEMDSVMTLECGCRAEPGCAAQRLCSHSSVLSACSLPRLPPIAKCVIVHAEG